MIPLRIIIEGFLCYRSAQEIDLADLRLCMLSGPNGSGKSTVFDAITFSLFGTHRAGSRSLDDLINKQSDSSRLTFDFLIDNQPWQIYRTIRRTKTGGTGTAELRQRSTRDPAQWETVPDAASKAGVDRWMAEHLSLNSAAFTRSILLRQGESDLLLSADTAERFKVLAGIADLEKYQQLEERAKDRFRAIDKQNAGIQTQLQSAPHFSDADQEQATQAAATAQALVQTDDESIERLQQMHVYARRWDDLQKDLSDQTQDCDAARKLIAGADSTEQQHALYLSLSAAMPHLLAIVKHRQRMGSSQAQLAQFDQRQGNLSADLSKLRDEAQTLRDAAAAQEAAIPPIEARLGSLSEKQAALTRILDAAHATQVQRSSLAQLEQQLTASEREHPRLEEEELPQAQNEERRLTSLKSALPALQRFAECRAEGIAAAERMKQAASARSALDVELKTAADNRTAIATQLEKADQTLAAAQGAQGEASARLQHAKSALSALDKAQGADCPTCGQPLTPEHLAAERERRNTDLQQCTLQKGAATRALGEAKNAVDTLRRDLGLLDLKIKDLGSAIQRQTTDHTRDTDTCRRADDGCRRIITGLPDDLREPIAYSPAAGFSATTWPREDDLGRLTDESATLPATGERLERLRHVLQHRKTLAAQAKTLRDNLAAGAVAIPQDIAAIRDEYVGVVAAHQEATQHLASARAAIQHATKQLQQSSAHIETLARELSTRRTQCEVERANARNASEAIALAQEQLASPWKERAATLGADALARWQAQLADLEHRNIPQAYAKLAKARQTLSAIEQRLAQTQAEVDRIPEPARRKSELVLAELSAAKLLRIQHDHSHRQADARVNEIAQARARRAELQADALSSAARLRHIDYLCKLLGKRSLQLHLIRQTERHIVQCANQILERLSAGDLYLHLRAATGDADIGEQALELLVDNRATAAGDRISVAFLSGSQRFRVAVALALAIGQIAGHRNAGDCVMIDEGFGSLDTIGQAVMIEELGELQKFLKCIILVSHQDSFASAFGQGYRFRLEDGETRVERVWK